MCIRDSTQMGSNLVRVKHVTDSSKTVATTTSPQLDQPGPASRAVRTAVIASLVGFTVASWIGDLLLSFLIPNHALVLLALRDGVRTYPLAALYTGPVAYYVVALPRLVVPHLLYFVIGRWYGNSAVRWVEVRTPALGSFLRTSERWFAKAPVPSVSLLHVNAVSVFAGASPMSFRRFVVAKVIGSLGLLVMMREASSLAEGPLARLGGFIGAHRPLMVGAVLVAFSAMLWNQRRSSGETELEHLFKLDEEIQATAIADARCQQPEK